MVMWFLHKDKKINLKNLFCLKNTVFGYKVIQRIIKITSIFIIFFKNIQN